jgi:hypothetical protein
LDFPSILGRQQSLQLFHGQPDARLDGTQRQDQLFGNLCLAVALEVGQGQHLSLFLGQLGDCHADSLLPD